MKKKKTRVAPQETITISQKENATEYTPEIQTPYEVIFYKKDNGESPVYDFIESQDNKMKTKIYTDIFLLELNGPKLKKPLAEHIRGKIYELRTQVGNNETRILYFFIVGKKIILTNGFTKKTNKTPAHEIEIADKYRADFISKNGGDNE